MNKIVFGSIFSAFLLVSLAWLTPINVKAAESEKEELKDMLLDFVITITNDEDYKKMINDTEIKAISLEILNTENENDKDNLMQDFDDLLKAKYLDLINRYIPTFQSLKNKIDDMNINTQNVEEKINDEYYYKIDVETDKFNIIKQKDENIEGSTILISSDASIKIPGHGWISEDIFEDILDFLRELLLNITIVFEAVLLFLEVIAYICIILDVIFGRITDIFYLLSEHTLCVMLYIMGIWIKVELALTVLIYIIEFISEKATKVKAVPRTSRFLENFAYIFRILEKRINQIFSRISFA